MRCFSIHTLLLLSFAMFMGVEGLPMSPQRSYKRLIMQQSREPPRPRPIQVVPEKSSIQMAPTKPSSKRSPTKLLNGIFGKSSEKVVRTNFENRLSKLASEEETLVRQARDLGIRLHRKSSDEAQVTHQVNLLLDRFQRMGNPLSENVSNLVYLAAGGFEGMGPMGHLFH